MNKSQNRRLVTGRRKTSGNLIIGMALLVVGSLLFAREFGADLPDWFFRWELILVVVGISIGVKSGFRDFGWIIVTGLGLFFLSDDIFPGWNATRFMVPAGLLALGAFILLTRLSASSSRDNLTFGNDPDPYIATEEQTKRGQFSNRGEQFTHRTEQPGDRTSQFTNRNEQSSERTSQFPNSNEQPGDPTSQFTNRTEQAADRDPKPSNPLDQFGDRNARPSNPIDQFINKGEQFPGSREESQNRSGQQSTRSEQYTDRETKYANQMQEEERLEIVSVFSAVNRKVFSKNFVGGEIVCVFGGSEVNLMNADISAGTIELEVVCIFGGATLFIPPNWNVRSEMGSVFGGVDDKRKNSIPDPDKTIIIKGVCIFGGLEVKTRFQ
ncbi:LiaF transmembrane domain-containing protein [Flavitalea antarctica]